MQNSNFSDKDIMMDALTSQKTVTGLFDTFSNECKCPELHKTMLDILNDEHAIQFEVFNEMEQRGFYSIPTAQQDKIDKLKSTYSASANNTTNTGIWHTDREEKKTPRM